MEAVGMSPFWQDRPTFVTGATGLVGSWVVRRLLGLGADVVCLVRDRIPQSEFTRSGLDARVRIVHGDICESGLLERILGEYEVRCVIHLAAQTIVPIANRNPISTFESNIAGTWNLLEACRRSPRIEQVVIASSDKAYGEARELPYDESTPLQGRDPYAVSKSCCDLISQTYAATYRLPVVTTRCGNFYGGGDLNWNRIVPGTIRSVLRGQRPVIRSDGQSIRDYFYVEDGAAAYTLLAEKLGENPALAGEAFNFSNETQITVLELVGMILREMGSDLIPEVRNEASNEIPNQYMLAKKAREALDWQPGFTLEGGLRRTVDWYREFFGNAALTPDS